MLCIDSASERTNSGGDSMEASKQAKLASNLLFLQLSRPHVYLSWRVGNPSSSTGACFYGTWTLFHKTAAKFAAFPDLFDPPL